MRVTLSSDEQSPYMHQATPLKRRITLPLITFYGLGNILGAGIYVLIGKVAANAGYLAPLSFFIASITVAFTAFSYAELSARYPQSAAEAVYIHKGLNIRGLTRLIGVLITAAGVVSSAAILQGFAGYFQVFVELPAWQIIITVCLIMGAVAIAGITQSVSLVALFTLIEIGGLLIILWVSRDPLVAFGTTFDWTAMTADHPVGVSAVFAGALLAFFAYTGFEDMVNVAEEVINPEHNMPLAIIMALLVSTVLYALVSVAAISVVDPSVLGGSNAPLAMVYLTATGREPVIISLISLFAIINGAMIQMIMISRVFYGMSCKGWLPSPLAYVHPRLQTPVYATLLATGLVMVAALSLPIVTLAQLTSYFLLMVFVLVNVSLWRIKYRHTETQVRCYPIWVPVLGAITSLFLIVVQFVF